MPNIPAFAQWLIDLLLYIPKQVYSLFCDALIAIINSLFAACTSCDFSAISYTLASLPQGMIWFLGMFQFGTGLSIVGGSFLIRFLIRRTPVVG